MCARHCFLNGKKSLKNALEQNRICGRGCGKTLGVVGIKGHDHPVSVKSVKGAPIYSGFSMLDSNIHSDESSGILPREISKPFTGRQAAFGRA